jgi:HSP20 family protein
MARDTGLARRRGDVTRYDPWNELQDMRRTMDSLFNQFFGYSPARLLDNAPETWANWSRWQPNVDLYETPDELVFRADLPGFKQEDIQLEVTSDTLRIEAQHQEQDSAGPSSADQPNAQGNGTGSQGNAPAQKDTQPSDGQGASSTAVQTAQPQHPRTYHIQSRQRQSFSVSYTLPVEIDPEKVSATFRDGVLEVHMPKPEQSKPKQVQVQVQS